MSSTNIEWTDATWNPVVGCEMVSPGCAHCYAERMSNRLAGMARADQYSSKSNSPGRKAHYLNVINEKGKWNGRVDLVPEALTDPFKWKSPRRVFVNSMSDLFHADVPFEFIDRVFAVMALNPKHTFQIMTKRPERMAEYLNDSRDTLGMKTNERVNAEACYLDQSDLVPEKLIGYPRSPVKKWPLPNVWLGTSTENQQTADARIPHLLRCPAAVRFLSVEPMLGPVNLQRVNCLGAGFFDALDGRGHDGSPTGRKHFKDDSCGPAIDWVIVGGDPKSSVKTATLGQLQAWIEAAGKLEPVYVKNVCRSGAEIAA